MLMGAKCGTSGLKPIWYYDTWNDDISLASEGSEKGTQAKWVAKGWYYVQDNVDKWDIAWPATEVSSFLSFIAHISQDHGQPAYFSRNWDFEYIKKAKQGAWTPYQRVSEYLPEALWNCLLCFVFMFSVSNRWPCSSWSSVNEERGVSLIFVTSKVSSTKNVFIYIMEGLCCLQGQGKEMVGHS